MNYLCAEQYQIDMRKPSFRNNPKPFKDTLEERIKKYFDSHTLSQKGHWGLYHKTIVLFGLLALCYIALFILPVSWVLIVIAALMGLIMSSIGFNVMHDGAHGSYSNNKRLNNFVTFIGGDLMGGSTFFWKIKHNIIHHTYTNIEGMDDDIAKYPIFRFCPHQKRKWFHTFQHLYAVPFYALTSIFCLFLDDYVTIFSKKINTTKVTTLKSKDITVLLLGKLLNTVLFVVIPLIYFGIGPFLIGFFTLHAVMGLTLALVFQMAHVVEDIEFPLPDEDTHKIENEWAIHQVKTTANFAMNNKFLSWLVGGLNYQVEHHLFPRISHVHYPQLSKIVQETCEDFGLKYNSFPTFSSALLSHFKLLKSLGSKTSNNLAY